MIKGHVMVCLAIWSWHLLLLDSSYSQIHVNQHTVSLVQVDMTKMGFRYKMLSSDK